LFLKGAIWGWVAASSPDRFLRADSASYHDSARALLLHRRYATSPEEPDRPQTWRTPGYPLLLAAVYALAGERPAAGVAAQIPISLATIALVAFIATSRWSSYRVGLLAALFIALDLNSAGFSLLLLTETLFTLAVALALLAGIRLQRGDEDQALKWVLILGLALVLATHTRPIAYYLVVPTCLWLAALGFHRGWPKARIGAALLLVVLPFALLVGGWQARNWSRVGSTEFSTIVGANLLFFKGAAVLADHEGIEFEAAQKKLRALYPESDASNEAELCARWKEAGLHLIAQHPFSYLRVVLRGAVDILSGPGNETITRLLGSKFQKRAIGFQKGAIGDLGPQGLLSYLVRWLLDYPLEFFLFALALAHLALVYACGGIAAWHVASKREWIAFDALAVGVAAYLLLLAAGPEGYYRFRVCITPILAIYAAAGLNHLIERFSTLSVRDQPSI
jgi:hypothetical protein